VPDTGRFHDDVASLRRFLVDEGFVDRTADEYLADRRARPHVIVTARGSSVTAG
jgi:hypothetical protein